MVIWFAHTLNKRQLRQYILTFALTRNQAKERSPIDTKKLQFITSINTNTLWLYKSKIINIIVLREKILKMHICERAIFTKQPCFFYNSMQTKSLNSWYWLWWQLDHWLYFSLQRFKQDGGKTKKFYDWICLFSSQRNGNKIYIFFHSIKI